MKGCTVKCGAPLVRYAQILEKHGLTSPFPRFTSIDEGTVVTMDLNKAKGVMFGLAIGDALGAPTEFLKLDQIRATYGKPGIRDLPVQALFTDDTQMSVAIAEALVRAGDEDVESIMKAVRDEFIKWSHLPETYTKAPGNTCLKGVANMERGLLLLAISTSMPPRNSGKWPMPQVSVRMVIRPQMLLASGLPTL
jgi:hypothetical protein